MMKRRGEEAVGRGPGAGGNCILRFALALLASLAVSTSLPAQPGAELDRNFLALSERLTRLEALVAAQEAERPLLTWDDCGAVPDDPTFDNGPVLSRVIAEQGRWRKTAPFGTARDYYVRTTIQWPKRQGGAPVGP